MTGQRDFHIVRLSHVAVNVTDLERSARFYQDTLGFVEGSTAKGLDPGPDTVLGKPFRRLFLTLGAQGLELTQWVPPGRPYPPASRANDLWFQHFAIVSRDIARAHLRLAGTGATPITTAGPQTLPPTSGGVTAYKFRDPDGHPLELLQFSGPAAMAAADTAINTGIDHTALSIGPGDESITFYRHVLGLSQVSTQENTGPAQDRLDALPHTAVQVTALTSAQKTPHLELLCYRTPRGRPRPSAANIRDVAASRTVFQVDRLPGLLAALVSHRAHSAASAGETLSASNRMALVRDPDGHLLVFEQT